MTTGFVTFSLVPVDFSVTDTVPLGPPACTPQISILSVRRLGYRRPAGARRTDPDPHGVISALDVAEVSKWRFLGDLP